jgi:AcrR family transcriptional regulator
MAKSEPKPMSATAAEPAPLGLRERKKARQREAILQAGVRLFRERGYEKVTVDDIAHAADISQPTFYKYFPSKDAILREFAMTGATTALDALMTQPGSVEARLRQFFQLLGTYLMSDRELWYAIAISNAYNPVRDPELLRAEDAATRSMERLLKEGQTRGELTRKFSAVRLGSVLEGLMLRACIEWGASFPEPHDLRESLDEMFDFFMRGARA